MNPNHDPKSGQFASSGGPAGAGGGDIRGTPYRNRAAQAAKQARAAGLGNEAANKAAHAAIARHQRGVAAAKQAKASSGRPSGPGWIGTPKGATGNLPGGGHFNPKKGSVYD